MPPSSYPFPKRAVILAGITILVLIGIGVIFFYPQKPSFDDRYQKAFQYFLRGDNDAAVKESQKALDLALTKDAEADIKRVLAANLLRRNNENDAKEAVRILKEIINDPAVSDLSHARALYDLAFISNLIFSQQFMEKSVFDEEPYATYLKESNTGILGAVRRIYEEADKVHPSAAAKLQIASKYAVPLLNGQTEKKLDAKKTAELIQEYVHLAAPLISNPPYTKSDMAYLHILHAASLLAIEQVLKSVTMQEVEGAYKEAILTAESASSDDARAYGILREAQLFYAMALANRFGKARADDIKNLIAPILSKETGYRSATIYLERVHLPATDFRKRSLLAIAKISPEFQSLLQELGWKE